jgi:serpin B
VRKTALAAALSAGLLAACGGAGLSEPAGVTVLGADVQRSDPARRSEDLHALTRAQVDFALDLYRAVSDEQQGDLAIGPGSLHVALSMMLAGADGDTAQEMTAVLHVGDLDERLHDLNNALDRELRSRGEEPQVEVDIANRLWAAHGLPLQRQFVTTLARHYGAGLAEVDFGGQPERARAAVNKWVATSTRDKISELFPAGTITHDTRLVLANAVHLDADWKFPFPASGTGPALFRLADGTVEVETMHYDEYLPSGRGPGWTAVRLPYAGEQLSMTVVVPEDLPAFERSLDAALLSEIDASIEDGGIHLALPRFTATTHLSLTDTLAEIGMPSAFGPGADFSGMTGTPGLYLAAVEHEVLVEVDEEGTKAAGASGGAFAGSHGPTVTVDRPFLFLVQDEPTGAVLFLGRVVDPR